jgi:transposase
MLEHGVLVLLFNETVETAREREYLSGEHFSVDGTLIQAWAGHKNLAQGKSRRAPIHGRRAGAPVS